MGNVPDRSHPRRAAFLSATAATALLPVSLRAQTLTQLRIAGTPDEDMIGSFWAQQSGIFQKYGFDADVRTIGSGAAITAAVIGGSLEIGKSSLLNLISAHAKGVPLVVVAAALLYRAAMPTSALVVTKGSPIRTGRDLNGATIAVASLGDFYALMNSAWIDLHGGDSQTVRYVELPPRAAADAVAAGRAAATTLPQPMLDQMMRTGRFRIVDHPFNSAASQFVMTAYFCTGDYLVKNGDVVARFRTALGESATYVNAHRPQMFPIIAKYSGADEATVASMPQVPLAQPRQLGAPLIQPLIDVALKYKKIDHWFAAKELVDPAV
jgi:NitT/TauT family transport system substrate-binding protein